MSSYRPDIPAGFQSNIRICPRCLGQMTMVCFDTDKDGVGRRTLGCAQCARPKAATVAEADPLLSDGQGWAASHLYPPS